MKRIVILVCVVVVAGFVVLLVSSRRTSERGPATPLGSTQQGGSFVRDNGRSVVPVIAPAVAKTAAVPVVAPLPVKTEDVQERPSVVATGVRPASVVVGHFADASIPFERRLTEIQALGRKGDTASQEMLMAIGDASVYANRYAVEALGQCRGPAVRIYLEGKLGDPDALLVCAVIRALERVAADAAIPVLARTLVDNRQRPDGHQELVCTEAVRMLGLTASAKAASALTSELERAGEKGWSLEYGSAVIAALRNIDSPDGVRSIAAYADVLNARIPEERVAKAYYERKIAEARGTLVPSP